MRELKLILYNQSLLVSHGKKYFIKYLQYPFYYLFYYIILTIFIKL